MVLLKSGTMKFRNPNNWRECVKKWEFIVQKLKGAPINYRNPLWVSGTCGFCKETVEFNNSILRWLDRHIFFIKWMKPKYPNCEKCVLFKDKICALNSKDNENLLFWRIERITSRLSTSYESSLEIYKGEQNEALELANEMLKTVISYRPYGA